jgi:chromosome segregation ATPase
MAYSGEEDVSSHEIDPDSIASIVKAIVQELSMRDRSQHIHSNRRVGVRHEVGIRHIQRSFGLSGSSNDTQAKRDSQMVELLLNQNKQNEEIYQLKSTITELKRLLEEETDKRKKADTDNAQLREKVQNLETEVSRLRDEIKQDKEDIKGLLDREQKRVFKD